MRLSTVVAALAAGALFAGIRAAEPESTQIGQRAQPSKSWGKA
jgi:hypothetical protein